MQVEIERVDCDVVAVVVKEVLFEKKGVQGVHDSKPLMI
jgi:hypothetical protein